MEYVIKKYRDVCRSKLIPLGFTKKGRAFVRVVNDVMQNVSVEKISSGRACRVEFSVIPLCLGIKPEYVLGGVYSHYLKGFEPIPNSPFDSWVFDPQLNETIDECMNEIERVITSNLIPFFERANSCSTALKELIELEKLFTYNRKVALKLAGMDDKDAPCVELNLLDSTKYYMALKNKDYAFALDCRKALLNQNLNAYEKRLQNGFLPQEALDKNKANIEKLKNEINHLEKNDTAYFQHLIEENEAFSRESIKSML